jgi:predicted metal-dependent HD superfamily phosphohydrolase
MCFDGIAPQNIYDDLLKRYSEPHRAYHTAQHLNECFQHLDAAADLAADSRDLGLALWFHDAIYDTSKNDNEVRSADLARQSLVGRSPTSVDRIAALVLATKHDAIPLEPDAKLLVDIDLSILGASPERFDEYERQVRFEYKAVPEVAFREGRTRILMKFLERNAIYSTEFFHKNLENGARENLTRSIEALKKTGS